MGNSQSLNPEGQVRKKERAKKGQVSAKREVSAKRDRSVSGQEQVQRRDGQKERPERGSGPTRLSAAEGRVRECTLSKISPERRSKSNPEESPV